MPIMTAKLLPSSSILCEAWGRKRRKSSGIDCCRISPRKLNHSKLSIEFHSRWTWRKKCEWNHRRPVVNHLDVIIFAASSIDCDYVYIKSAISDSIRFTFCDLHRSAIPWKFLPSAISCATLDARWFMKHHIKTSVAFALEKLLQNYRWFKLRKWRWFMNRLVFISGISQTECKKPSTESQTMQSRFSFYSNSFLLSRHGWWCNKNKKSGNFSTVL